MQNSLTLFSRLPIATPFPIERLSQCLKMPCTDMADVDDEFWLCVSAVSDSGEMRLNWLRYTRNADRFSKLVARTLVRFEGVTTRYADQKRTLLDHVENTTATIGIVADFDLNLSTVSGKAVLDLARELEALVWNGEAFLDADGRQILRLDGESDF